MGFSELNPGSLIVEIGVLHGLSTCFLGYGSKKSGAVLYAVDPFDSDFGRQKEEFDGYVDHTQDKSSRNGVLRTLERGGLSDCVELVEGFSSEVAKEWNREINFLWIDGNHRQFEQDYVSWRHFLVDGSRIAFHDSHPKYGFVETANYVKDVVANETVERLEQVKSITSFIIRNP